MHEVINRLKTLMLQQNQIQQSQIQPIQIPNEIPTNPANDVEPSLHVDEYNQFGYGTISNKELNLKALNLMQISKEPQAVRPGLGTLGIKTQLRANYVKVSKVFLKFLILHF